MVKPTMTLVTATQIAAITRGGIRFLCFLCDRNYGRASRVMHQHTYVTLADAEARALPCEVGGLRYANVKWGIGL
jgi:hypothetical protein